MEEKSTKQNRKGTRRWLVFFAAVMLLSFGALGYRLIDLQVLRPEQIVVLVDAKGKADPTRPLRTASR